MNTKLNYIEGNTDYSTNEPLWRVAVLSIITLNLYLFFWFFINLRRIKFIKRKGLSPWIALIMGIPIVNIFVPYYLFYNILDLNIQNKFKNHLKCIFLTFAFLCLLYSAELNAPYCLIYLLVFIPILYLQNEINMHICNN